MALRRIPAADLCRVTLRQALRESTPAGHCFISFRAGALSKTDGKLVADKRRGQVAVVKTNDGILCVQFFLRQFPNEDDMNTYTLPEEPESEQHIFRDEATWSWFHKGNRVLKLGFKDEPDRNMFFWLQEPSKDTDEEILSRCNKALHGIHYGATSPAAAAPGAAGQAASSAAASAANTGMAQMLQHRFEQTTDGFVTLEDGFVTLEDVVTADAVTNLLQQDGVQEQLLQHLPPGLQTAEELSSLPHCRPFWQQLRVLGSGIQTASVDMTQFGLNPAAPGVAAFLREVQEVTTRNTAAAEKEGTGASATNDASGGDKTEDSAMEGAE